MFCVMNGGINDFKNYLLSYLYLVVRVIVCFGFVVVGLVFGYCDLYGYFYRD